MSDNGWNKYQELVLAELERHDSKLEAINDRLSVMMSRISALEVRAGVWGLIGGLIPVAVALALVFLKS